MNDLVPLITLTIAVLFIILGLRAAVRAIFGPKPKITQDRQAPPGKPQDIEVNARSILVDGSNVMHWNDNKPSPATLQRVLAALRNAGNDPILCFDANVGYKLVNTYMDRAELAKFFGVQPRNILVCPSGTDGDAMILRIAVEKSLPVVSNDQYRDYPDLIAQVSTMTGKIKGTKVDLRFHDKTPMRA